MTAFASEDVDSDCSFKNFLCFLRKWLVRFVVLPLYFRIVLTGHNLHATLVLLTGPSFSFKKTKVVPYAGLRFFVWNNFKRFFTVHVYLLRKGHKATGSDGAMLPRGGTIKCLAAILNAHKSLEANLENKHGGPCRGRLFWHKIVPYT